MFTNALLKPEWACADELGHEPVFPAGRDKLIELHVLQLFCLSSVDRTARGVVAAAGPAPYQRRPESADSHGVM